MYEVAKLNSKKTQINYELMIKKIGKFGLDSKL